MGYYLLGRCRLLSHSFKVILVLLAVFFMACSGNQSSTTPLSGTITETTKNPLTDRAAALTGKSLYVVNCSLCHGESGGAPEDSLGAKPPDLTVGKVVSDADGAIFLAIKNGIKKDGKQTMPPAKKLSNEEIWQIVAYVRTLAKK